MKEKIWKYSVRSVVVVVRGERKTRLISIYNPNLKGSPYAAKDRAHRRKSGGQNVNQHKVQGYL